MDDIKFLVGEIRAELRAVARDVHEIKEKVEGHESLKNKIVGLCIAVSAGVGVTASQVIEGVKSLFTSH